MGNVKVGNFPIQTGPDFLSEMGRNRGLGRFHDHVGVVGGQVGVPSDGLWWSEEVLGGQPGYPGGIPGGSKSYRDSNLIGVRGGVGANQVPN
jgi:hypothetical protein